MIRIKNSVRGHGLSCWKKVLIFFYVAGSFYLPFSANAEESLKTLCGLGQKAFEEQKYQKAIDYFEEAISLNSNFAPAYHALGLVYQQVSSDPNYPLWYFETALEIDPNFVPSMDVLCRSYYQMQDYDKAEDICLKALEKNPDLPGSQLALAWTYLLGRSDAEKAIYYFEKVQKKLKVPAVDLGLGMAYAIRGDHGKVLDIVTRLRAEGMEEFAAHLEGMLRSRANPEDFMPANFVRKQKELEQKQAEQIARMQEAQATQETGEETQFVPVPVVVKPKITGSPNVRIRGKIKPPQVKSVSGYSEPKTYGGQGEKHPGSLEDW